VSRSPVRPACSSGWRRRLLACVCLFAAGAAFGAEKPRRVASLNLAADEVLVEILPAGRLVSVTRWADEPGTSNVAGRVPASVYRFFKSDMEQLVALSPDLVVVSEFTDADFLKLLERSGMPSHRMRGLDSLSGIRAAILDLGRAVGEVQAAERLVAGYEATLADVAKRLAGAPKPRVLYWSGGMTAGSGTMIGALIEAAGAVNLGRELGVAGVAPPGGERAFVADPDFILVGSWPLAVESLKSDPLIGKTRAVREGHVIVMPDHLLVALSQYTADAVRDLASRLHPERMSRPQP
jgi:iron complex transport system substrate-binding protein